MLAEVVKIEQVIREVPEGGMAWNLLCEVVNTLLETNHPPPPAGLWRTSKEDEHHEHLPGKVAEETQPAENSGGIGAPVAAIADNSSGDEHSDHSAADLAHTERMKITPEMSALQRFEARYGKK